MLVSLSSLFPFPSSLLFLPIICQDDAILPFLTPRHLMQHTCKPSNSDSDSSSSSPSRKSGKKRETERKQSKRQRQRQRQKESNESQSPPSSNPRPILITRYNNTGSYRIKKLKQEEKAAASSQPHLLPTHPIHNPSHPSTHFNLSLQPLPLRIRPHTLCLISPGLLSCRWCGNLFFNSRPSICLQPHCQGLLCLPHHLPYLTHPHTQLTHTKEERPMPGP